MKDYTSLPRRFIRLAHIAFIALGLISVAYGFSYDLSKLKTKTKKVSAIFLVIGTILMPIILILAAYFEIIKYFSSIPITLIILSLIIFVYGLIKTSN